MADDPSAQDNTRITVSLATLRYELSQLELRFVDRMNGALANKADRAIQDQLAQRVSDLSGRVQSLEGSAVTKDSPVAQRVESHETELIGLRSVANYRKWFWAQTIAIFGVMAALIGVVVALT